MSVMRPHGWELFRSLSCASGTDAYDIEQKVLERLLRDELEVPQYLSQRDLPQSGATKAFGLADISLLKVWELVQQTAAAHPLAAM